MKQAQLRSLQPWLTYLGVGAFLYAVLTVSGIIYAGRNDLPRWETVVTLVEWAVALMFLPRILIIARREEMARKSSRFIVGLIGDGAWIAGVLLTFSVLTRAVLGLGFKPF